MTLASCSAPEQEGPVDRAQVPQREVAMALIGMSPAGAPDQERTLRPAAVLGLACASRDVRPNDGC